jgi:hypothetical protein
MLHQHMHPTYVDAVVDRRTPRPARLLELAERQARRRARRAS